MRKQSARQFHRASIAADLKKAKKMPLEVAIRLTRLSALALIVLFIPALLHAQYGLSNENKCKPSKEEKTIGITSVEVNNFQCKRCTSSKHMAPLELFSKRYFSAHTFSSLAC